MRGDPGVCSSFAFTHLDWRLSALPPSWDSHLRHARGRGQRRPPSLQHGRPASPRSRRSVHYRRPSCGGGSDRAERCEIRRVKPMQLFHSLLSRARDIRPSAWQLVAEVCIGDSRFFFDPAVALDFSAAQAYCAKAYGSARPGAAHLAYLSRQQQRALLQWLQSLPPSSAAKPQAVVRLGASRVGGAASSKEAAAAASYFADGEAVPPVLHLCHCFPCRLVEAAIWLPASTCAYRWAGVHCHRRCLGGGEEQVQHQQRRRQVTGAQRPGALATRRWQQAGARQRPDSVVQPAGIQQHAGHVKHDPGKLPADPAPMPSHSQHQRCCRCRLGGHIVRPGPWLQQLPVQRSAGLHLPAGGRVRRCIHCQLHDRTGQAAQHPERRRPVHADRQCHRVGSPCAGIR
jgi:hypothetical protein